MESIDGGNLDQVRDILFGAQLRDFEQGLSRLDERLTKELNGLKQDAKNRTDSLELYVKNEIQSLIDRSGAEQQESKQAAAELAKQIKELGKELKADVAALDKKLSKLDDKLTKSERTTRQHILDEAKSLRDSLVSKYEEQSNALQREAQQLREAKVDRAALSDLLKEMSLRITGELDLSDLDKKPK